jgi:hypothetical protein
MVVQLLLPVLLLMAATVGVARLVEARMPETLGGILAGLAISAVLALLLSAALFAAIYARGDPRILDLLGQAPQIGLAHFLGLGAKAGLIWGPVLLLVTVTAPRRWTTNTW